MSWPRTVAAIAVVACALLEGVRGQTPAVSQRPFRAGVDLVQVDVSVLDKKRAPVRGLTAADFTLLEDGRPRPIVAFTAVDLPAPPPRPPAAWVRDVAPDVATNAVPDEGRLVVIVMDRTIPDGEPTMTAKRIAKAAVDAMGPGDLAAVMYTGFGVPHDFTPDRTRLRRAIDESSPASEPSDSANEIMDGMAALAAEAGITVPVVSNTGACYCGLCVLETITRAADAVRDVARRRKSLFFIGRDLTVESSDMDCGYRLKQAREQMFRSLALANVTVHSFDPSGLETLAPAASSNVRAGRAGDALVAGLQRNVVRQSNLGLLPDRTGGRTVMNSNDTAGFVKDVFRESDSYYLIGFEPADRAAPGTLHDIKIRVNRPGLDVRSRSGYVTPADAAAAPSAAGPPPAGGSAGPALPLAGAIRGLLPERSGIALRASAAAFAVAEKPGAIIALALTVQQNALDPSAATAATAPRPVDVLVAVFNRTGRAVGTLRQTIQARPRAGTNGAMTYEVASRLPLGPGRYELRIAVEDKAAGQTGSVYTFVDVPSFSRPGVTLSDIVLRGPASATPTADLAAVLPVAPSARRDFSASDRVAAFVRVYQGGASPLTPVTLDARIVDDENHVRFNRSQKIAAEEFKAARAADDLMDVPLGALVRGEYLLTIEASAGKSTSRRETRFSVR